MSVLAKPAPQVLLLGALMICLQHCGVQFSRWRWYDFGSLKACGVRCLIDDSLGEGKEKKRLRKPVKERSMLSVWPRALNKEPPIDSHRWRA
eukprot:1155149-Pelagomonas_calceolata.AAC.4